MSKDEYCTLCEVLKYKSTLKTPLNLMKISWCFLLYASLCPLSLRLLFLAVRRGTHLRVYWNVHTSEMLFLLTTVVKNGHSSLSVSCQLVLVLPLSRHFSALVKFLRQSFVSENFLLLNFCQKPH